ncbi:unnamed protein product [Acanthoscelides obtectus]|uniref:Uncharacterized protein n=1 Tax=Acanthoscelides obtectus TaxID=200917 RepID=A0A9P0K078_ACAOB|nr:unnamed protein product [Acanthoscelides obtectus]CAK1646175.1 hypothetical protein AOBTE_LOCUS14493 [Acanthoscelides obtectus]
MKSFASIVAICCLASAKALPSIGHHHHQLQGVPDLQQFAAIKYPHFMLIHLGEYSKGHVPGPEIHETKHITVKEPQPYPVHIPVPHPYPVPIHKPYPVVETKYIKVPHAVPYEVVKKVPVPIEVPKPYPVEVPVHGHGWDQNDAGTGNVAITAKQDVENDFGGEQQQLTSSDENGELEHK